MSMNVDHKLFNSQFGVCQVKVALEVNFDLHSWCVDIDWLISGNLIAILKKKTKIALIHI